MGVYLKCHESCVWGYYFIDDENELVEPAFRAARWKWICRLVEADTADVSGDIYAHFAANTQDFHQLAPREFETLRVLSPKAAAHQPNSYLPLPQP